MNANQCTKLMDAINKVGIKKYQFDTDLGTHLYNNDNSIAIAQNDLEAVICIRSSQLGGSHNVYEEKVQVVMSDYGDIHECRTAGTSEQIIALVNELGITLDDEQTKIVVNIDKRNYDIKPSTGDYVSRFNYLTQSQYDALSDEEKAKYDAEKKAYEDKQKSYTGQNMSARITL